MGVRQFSEERRTPSPASGRSVDADPNLGEVLLHARKHRDLSLRQVEKLTGIPNAHLSQIERSQIKKPAAETLWQLAEVYKLKYEALLEWAGHRGVSEGDPPLVSATVRLLLGLDPQDQRRVLEYVRDLAAEGPTS